MNLIHIRNVFTLVQSDKIKLYSYLLKANSISKFNKLFINSKHNIFAQIEFNGNGKSILIAQVNVKENAFKN